MLELMTHQKEALHFLSDRDSGGLFFEMGLGKTVVALEHLANLALRSAKPFPCLIVAPLSVLMVWQKEVEKFGYPFKVKLLLGSRQDRINTLAEEADIYLINYEGLRILPAQLEQKKFRTILLDEAHRIKERSSIQTSIILKLGALCPYRYILTGTPITKSPEDVWTQIQFLQPGYLGNFFSFRSKYIEYKKITVRAPGGKRTFNKPYRFKHLKELEGKLSQVALRKTKAECLDLPKKVYSTLYCEMSEEQKKHYFTLKNSLATLINNHQYNVSTAATLLQKLQQVCNGFIYDELKQPIFFDDGKLEVLKDLLSDLEGQKSIVFAWFQADVDRLYQELSKTHKVLLYEGSAVQRSTIEKEFQETEEPVVFLAQIERAKEGITLTAASNVIYYGNSWSHATRVQSEDRAHRKGQTKTVVYYDLVYPNAADEMVKDALHYKADIADKITGDSIRLKELAKRIAA